MTPRAVKLHVLSSVAVLACLALGGWQLHRALTDHNQLSWAYTFEWPFFAGYVSWMWWKLLHEEPEFGGAGRGEEAGEGQPGGERPATSGQPQPGDDVQEGELAAYNDYLARLDSSEPGSPR